MKQDNVFAALMEPLQRATEIFTQLQMHQTQLRNSVIIFVATKARKFAIYGDEGINKVVPVDLSVTVP